MDIIININDDYSYFVVIQTFCNSNFEFSDIYNNVIYFVNFTVYSPWICSGSLTGILDGML